MTIRIEVVRDLKNLKQGRGRNNRTSPVSVSHESDIASAIEYVRDNNRACEDLAPGYMPLVEARFYSADAFRTWVVKGGEMPVPMLVLAADEIVALA